MKILYLCHPDNYHIEKWVKGLTRKGVEIYLAGLEPQGEIFAPYTRWTPLTGKTRYWDFLRIAPKVSSLFKKLDADLIFASFATTFGLSAQLSGVRPYAVQTWSRDIGQDPNMSLRERLMVHHISPRVWNAAAGITTDGMAYKDYFLKKWPQYTPKTLGTPWGINLYVFQYDEVKAISFRKKYHIPADAKIVTSSRGVGNFYQPEEVLKGVLNAAAQNPKAWFLVPTLAHERNTTVKKLLSECEKRENITVIDRLLTQDEMVELWSATDFFISTPWFDGVSEGLSEGRAMHAVPLLNSLPSNLERAQPGQHAFYLSGGEVKADELSNLITQALHTSPEIIQKMILENKKWVAKNADVDKTLGALIDFFHGIISKHHG